MLYGLWNWNRPRPKAKVPDVQSIPSPKYRGATRKKIRYGPYRVPPVSEKTYESQLLNVQGIASTLQWAAQKPCDRDCLMLALNASLEYDDGSPAENESGVSWSKTAVEIVLTWSRHGFIMEY
jgi:hypothetical protein